jgi:hypothetical protein
VCDLAWVLLADRERALALADRQAILTAALPAGMADKITLPDPDEAVTRLAAALAAPPKARPDAELREILGVA